MGIERIIDAGGIAKILKLEDNIEECFPCTRGEWIQWLMSVVDQLDKIYIMGITTNEKLTGYFVVVNSVLPPLCDSVFALYSYSPKNVNENIEGLLLLKDWAKEQGAKSIKFMTKNVLAHKMYGFVETGNVEMEMVL